jgi:hypothetical protein
MQISRLLYGHEISILLLKGEPSINFIKQVLSMFSYVLIMKALLSQNS